MDDENRFGRIAVRKGLLGEEELEEALRVQDSARRQGRDRRIGALLCEKGVLDPASVREILREQGKALLRCLACRTPYTVSTPDTTRLACPRCGGALDPTHEEDLGEDSPPVLEKEGTLYLIEDDSTLLSGADSVGPPFGSGAPPPVGDVNGTISGTFGGEIPPPAPMVLGTPSECLEIGTVVGGCEIRRLAGRGGMGAVYEAEHIALHKRVALKILAPHLMGQPVLVARFLQEARTAAKLEHPHVVQVHDVGQEGPFHYIVMQYVEGESLGSLIDREGALSVERALEIAAKVAEGLGAAHEMGVIHRDVKPGNILIQKDGVPKIADFGLAKEIDAEASLSRAGQVLGSPHYLSPEQADGQEVDRRTDIYSLGVTLFHALSGRRPYSARSPVGVIMKHIKEPAPDLRKLRPELPPVVAGLVSRMMAKDPAQRFQSCRELREAIQAILDPSHILELAAEERRRSRWPAAAAGAVLVLLFAGALALALALGWIPVGSGEGDESAERGFRRAAALLEEDPPETERALEGFRAVVTAYGPQSEWGRRAREKIDLVHAGREREAARRLASARDAAERALAAGKLEDAEAAIEGLPAAVSGTPSEDAALLLERRTRRRVKLARTESRLEVLEAGRRYDDILLRLEAMKAAFPAEDRIFVSEVQDRWKARRAAWEEKARKALSGLLIETGDPPGDTLEALRKIRAFSTEWAGSAAALEARAIAKRLEQGLTETGNPEADFRALEELAARNPTDLDAAIGRFRAFAGRAPRSRWTVLAASKATDLEERREFEARTAFASLKALAAGLSVEEAIRIWESFPPGIRGSRTYSEDVSAELKRLAGIANADRASARKAFEAAETLEQSTPKPWDAAAFADVVAAYRAVYESHVGTEEADRASFRIDRLEGDRVLEAGRAFRRADEAAGIRASGKDWDGAARIWKEDFLDIYSDTALRDRALERLEAVLSSGSASMRRMLEDEAATAMAGLRGQAARAEAAGRLDEAIRIYRGFPRAYFGTRAHSEALAAIGTLEEAIRAPLAAAERLLAEDPRAFSRALDLVRSVSHRFPGTSWAREAEDRLKAIESRARREAETIMGEGEAGLSSGEFERAARLFDEIASWNVQPFSRRASGLAARCRARIERSKLLALLSEGRHEELRRRAEALLAREGFDDEGGEIKALVDHAVNLSEGFVYVPGGAFDLGEGVRVLEPFYILQTEVTNAHYQIFIVSGGYDRDDIWDADASIRSGFKDRTGRQGPRHWRDGRFPDGEVSNPVRYVSWFEARAYARWKGGDLPTENQWMMAAGWDASRARLRTWPWGESFDPDLCWAGRTHESPAVKPVGSFPLGASCYRLLDAAGNVSEWVRDWADEGRRRYRVLKGGDSSDFDTAMRTRVASRERAAPESAHPLSGFRIVRPGKVIPGLR